MLSKTSIVIMGLLCEEELSAYDMLRRIEQRNMKYWWPIGDTTLYETAIRLEKKKFIEGNQQGNKLLYHITMEGREEFESSMSTIFTRVDFDSIWFSLATLFCGSLKTETLVRLMDLRGKILNEYSVALEEVLKQHRNDTSVPYQGVLTIERMLQIVYLEQKALEELKERNKDE